MTPQELAQRAQRARREFIRWILLLTLNLTRPAESTVGMLRSVVAGEYADVTDLEVRRELDYLHERELVINRIDPVNHIYAKLTRHGVDVVEYTVSCDAGIARPQAGA